eukprot:scaffold108267_cov67-Cyclotella_meneghiniana.AAC.1
MLPRNLDIYVAWPRNRQPSRVTYEPLINHSRGGMTATNQATGNANSGNVNVTSERGGDGEWRGGADSGGC